MSSDKLITILVLAAAAFIVWEMLRPKYSLRIRVEGGCVKSHTGVAQGQLKRVIEFLEHDLATEGNFTILGARGQRGALHISFRGDIDQGTAQQIRNFLKIVL